MAPRRSSGLHPQIHATDEGTGMARRRSPRLHLQIQASEEGAGVTRRRSPRLHPQIHAGEEGAGVTRRIRRRRTGTSPTAAASLPDDAPEEQGNQICRNLGNQIGRNLLKQQIQPRSVSDSCFSSHPDSCSSSHPGQLRMNLRKPKEVSHSWTIPEQLYLLKPFTINFEAEEVKFKADRNKYCEEVSNDMNKRFAKYVTGWVPLTLKKIRRKFDHFGLRHQQQNDGDKHPIFDEVPTKDYELLEYYIARYGETFIPPPRSSSRTSSHTPSASSVGTPKEKKRSRRRIKAVSKELQMAAASKFLLKHVGDDKVSYLWYMRILDDKTIRRGFWDLPDDYTPRKDYLDKMLPTAMEEWMIKNKLKMKNGDKEEDEDDSSDYSE